MPKKKGNKGKRNVGRPAIRKCNAKNARSIPDISQIATLPLSQETQSPLDGTNFTNQRSENVASGETAGSSCMPVGAEASETARPCAPPLTTAATRELISRPFSGGALAGPSSNPGTSNDKLAQIPSLSVNPEETSSEPFAESFKRGEQPNNKDLSSSDDTTKHQRGEIEAGENLVPESPPRRVRKSPTRFDAIQPEQKPEKRNSIFEVLSRDTLQKYMVHYNIPKRQDLKKNLVARVQEHFNSIDHEDIDLTELTKSVRARLHQPNTEAPKKRKK